MNWRVGFSRDAETFIKRNRIDRKEIFDLIQKSLFKFRGETVNVDIKKLKGGWDGFYRIRKGVFRVIIEFDFDSLYAFVEQIDQRGGAYK